MSNNSFAFNIQKSEFCTTSYIFQQTFPFNDSFPSPIKNAYFGKPSVNIHTKFGSYIQNRLASYSG